MFNKLIDFGASLCDSYTAWIICSILFFAYLMGTEYKKVYSFHLEMRSSPSKNGIKLVAWLLGSTIGLIVLVILGISSVVIVPLAIAWCLVSPRK